MAGEFNGKADMVKSAALLSGLAVTAGYTSFVFATYAAACWQSACLGVRYRKQVETGRLMMKEARGEQIAD